MTTRLLPKETLEHLQTIRNYIASDTVINLNSEEINKLIELCKTRTSPKTREERLSAIIALELIRQQHSRTSGLTKEKVGRIQKDLRQGLDIPLSYIREYPITYVFKRIRE